MKKKYYILLIVTLTTIVQYYWFLPEGKSCSDPLEDNTWLSLLLMLFLILIGAALITRFSKKHLLVKLSIFLSYLWFFSNYQSFNDRVSCWSTYLFFEEINEVLFLSILPIFICLIIFIAGYFFLDKLKKQVKTEDKTI